MAAREDSFEGSLTKFAGFPFGPDRPYVYGEAKRVLRLALEELRLRRDLWRELGMDSKGQGRPAITGRDAASVWDIIPLQSARAGGQFTRHPHLTLSLEIDRILAHVVFPHQLEGTLKRRLRSLSRDELGSALAEIVRNLRPVIRDAPGSAPWFIGIQRHYPSRSAPPIHDARVEFDLRTICPGDHTPVKAQPVLLDAAHEALQNRQPNYQMSIGLVLPYRSCEAAREPNAIDLIARSWIACKPLLDLVLTEGAPSGSRKGRKRPVD